MSENNETEEKLILGFRVDPDWLKEKTKVLNPVKLVYTGRFPLKFMELKLLNESGTTMFFHGAPFDFEQESAEALIKAGFGRKFGTPQGET